MKMVSARLKMVILKVHITAYVMTMALMRMKHGCMEIGVIRLVYTNGIFGHEVKATKRPPPHNLM